MKLIGLEGTWYCRSVWVVAESAQHLNDTIILVKGSCNFMRWIYEEKVEMSSTPDYMVAIISQ